MNRWMAVATMAAAAAAAGAGAARAQGRPDGAGAPPVLVKPAPGAGPEASAPIVQKPAPLAQAGGVVPGVRPGTSRPAPAPGAPTVVVPPPGGGAPSVGGSRYYPPPGGYWRPAPPRAHVDVYIGSPWRPWYGPGWYPGWGWSAYPPVVVAPPVVVSPPPNVVYVERAPEPVDPGAAPAAGYWYWCAEPQGWYPEVRECTNGWQPVPPRAQAQ